MPPNSATQCTGPLDGYIKSALSGYCAPPLLTAVLGWAKKWESDSAVRFLLSRI